MRHFDLIVIGSGPAGRKAAIQAAKLGRSVCVVERTALGGGAVNTGTVPSKTLREAVLDLTGRGHVLGQDVSHLVDRETQFRMLMDSCQRVINSKVDVVRKQFARNGVKVAIGSAAFLDEHTIAIETAQNEEKYKAEYILIAVGSVAAKPPDIPFDGHRIFTADEIYEGDRGIARSVIIVGGGVIGTEYASMATRLGIRVTLVEGRNRVLDFVDIEIGEALQYHLRQAGMTLRLGEKVVKVEVIDPPPGSRPESDKMVEATLESGKVLRADRLLYSVGRQGATGELNLGAASLSADQRGRIAVNEHYQTSVSHIYACGDVIGFPALAATAMEQGRVACCQMFGQPTDSLPHLIPYGIYSIPEISMIGKTEEQLTAEAMPFERGVAQYRETARGQILGDDIGMLKLLVHQKTHEILGVHTIGTGATELIHIGQAVMATNGTADYFVNAVFNYPTLAECYKVAALNALNKLRGA
ncbi:MAG: Si-specific NAD(P)(+) transhydrogenase [Acidiferrobacterales bacterium]